MENATFTLNTKKKDSLKELNAEWKAKLKTLEDELKEFKKNIKAIENKRDELVESARKKISRNEAR